MEIGSIGIGNISTMATFIKMFARVIAGVAMLCLVGCNDAKRNAEAFGMIDVVDGPSTVWLPSRHSLCQDVPEASMAPVSATRLRLEKTYIPEIFLYSPATMADFAKYMEGASRDFHPFDMPEPTNCIVFTCSNSAAGRVFPPRPAQPEQMIHTLSGKRITLWDALTNACQLTACTFTISTNFTVCIDHVRF